MASSLYKQALEWSKLLTITGLAQVLVKGLAFLSGIIVIRYLPTHEYALYTIANTLLGTMTMLSDGGIKTGVMSQGGKVWKDPARLGTVVVTGMHLRRKFAVFSVIVTMPILFVLLQKHDCSLLTSSLIALSLIPTFYSAVSGDLLEIAPKLTQDIGPLQRIEVSARGGRLALSAMLLFVFPYAAVAIMCTGISQLYGNYRLRKMSAAYVDRDQAEDPAVRGEIVQVVKRILPGALYYSVSGQLLLWMISIFGSTESLAQAGALTRLAMVLSLFSSIAGILIVPRYARMEGSRTAILRLFLVFQACLLLLGMIILGLVMLFPSQVLWILGSDYSHLNQEVVLMAAGATLSFVGGVSSSLNAARGALFSAKILLTVSIASNLLIFTVDYTQLSGLLIYNIMISAVHLIYNTVCALIKTTAHESSAQEAKH